MVMHYYFQGNKFWNHINVKKGASFEVSFSFLRYSLLRKISKKQDKVCDKINQFS